MCLIPLHPRTPSLSAARGSLSVVEMITTPDRRAATRIVKQATITRVTDVETDVHATRSYTIVARTRADAAPASLIPPGCSSLVSKYRSLTWSRILHSLGLARAHSAECAQFACSSRWPRSLRLTSHCLLSLFSRPAWPWPCQCTLAPHRFSGPPGRRRAVVARRRARW